MEEAPVIFPNSRSILWSREPTGKPHYIHAEEVMPPLYLSPSAMSSLVESCSRDADDRARMTERVASIVPVEEVLAETIGTREGDYFQGPWKTMLGSSAYVIKLSENLDGASQHMSSLVGPAVNSKLTIPVMLRSDWEDTLVFDKESTR